MTAFYYIFVLLCIAVGVASILNSLSLCSHSRVTRPYSHRVDVNGIPYMSQPTQVCLDCGARRLYVIGTEPGEIQTGPWYVERVTPMEVSGD